ncbi:glycine betaine/L-proline ABC transporter permease/substrate-binding protein [Erysipelotrichaceae bacterium]|nr:glycine betaine/L-proline ABC transporter permease/substrate-binding protein [Erysipelotrichaceae bacterium]
MQDWLTFLQQQQDAILTATYQHIYLSAIALLIATSIAIPAGIIATKNRILGVVFNSIISVFQAIPSIAILGFMIPFLGIGDIPAVLMVAIYSMLPILKNTYTGLTTIDPTILEAARGMGMSPRQRLWKIELPLALPVMMSGIRIAAVGSIGLMTIATFVGGGGLGSLIFAGTQVVNMKLILAGAIPAVLLALAIDFCLSLLEKKLHRGGFHYNKKKSGLLVCACIFIIGGFFFYNPKEERVLVIGGKRFTEHTILVNILGELIEAKTDIRVITKTNLGSTQIVWSAFENNEIDTYVEYTGTAFLNILQQEYSSSLSAADIEDTVRLLFSEKNITTYGSLGFNNTYGIAVDENFAQKNDLKTLSDLEKLKMPLRVLTTTEFSQRADGITAMQKVYPFLVSAQRTAEDALRYSALENLQTDLIDVYTTDALNQKFPVRVLEDNRQFFLPYQPTPIIHDAILVKYPELDAIFKCLEGSISTAEMIEMNYAVTIDGKTPEEVASAFLRNQGWV